MTAQITGLAQAQRNANDGISIAQTAEGSLNQVNDNLQRIRELTVQAANGTNSEDDLQSIQEEIDQRLGEIDRISEETAFNGVDVLAEDRGLVIQVGANDGETITVGLQEINRDTLGLRGFSVADAIVSKDLTEVAGNISEAVPATTVDIAYNTGSASNLDLFVGNDGNLYAGDSSGDFYEASYDGATGVVSYNTTDTPVTGVTDSSASTFVDASGNVVELTTAEAATQTDTAAAASYEIYQADADGTLVVYDGTDSWTLTANDTGNDNTINLETGVVTLGAADATAVTVTAGHTQATNDSVLTTSGTAAVAADLTNVDANLEGTNTLMQHKDGDYYIKNVNTVDGEEVTTYHEATVAADGVVSAGASAVVDPLKDLDDALSQVDTLRSELGAVQNRFEDAITNLNTNETNLAAARSRIEDADYAVEVANMTRAQILQQAGTSVLAQANQIPQNVLSLLG